MHLYFRNVNDAFYNLVQDIETNNITTVRTPSRYGDVIQVNEPVLITYSNPKERVLFNRARDVNPFFHLYEALWMLAGRNDVSPLAYYNSRMKEFSDNGSTFNGAYGYRWRNSKPLLKTNRRPAGWDDGRGGRDYDAWERESTDQLNVIVEHLKALPHSRRAVLQMWNVEDDLLKIGDAEVEKEVNEICPQCKGKWDGDRMSCMFCEQGFVKNRRRVKDRGSKDVCCNLSVMFALRPIDHPDLGTVDHLLDITVTNRSNDLVWGLLGANYVQFTFLQEYIAARLGVEVGEYHHFTNNLHAYTNNWKPDEWINAEQWSPTYELGYALDPAPSAGGKRLWKSVPLVTDPAVFEKEVYKFVERHKDGLHRLVDNTFTEPFLRDVAHPMMQAFHFRKDNEDLCDTWLSRIVADDWRIAAAAWVYCRRERAKK